LTCFVNTIGKIENNKLSQNVILSYRMVNWSLRADWK
jgi:hypothetical protein